MELAGQGRLWVDATGLEVLDDESITPVTNLENAGFETGKPGEEPPGWDGPEKGRSVFYGFNTVAADAPEGEQFIALVGEPISSDLFPSPSEPLVTDLGGGVTARVPLSLSADEKEPSTSTPDSWQLSLPSRPEGWAASANDRPTRLADVIIAWNIFQHFYPYFDEINTDWENVLSQSLVSASTDPDEREFLVTLRRLVATLYDCHGSVYHPVYRYGVHPPVRWEWIEDSIVVTAVSADVEDLMHPGDVVLEIDGKPAIESLQALQTLFSGATLQWRRWRALGEIGDGEENSHLNLKILTPEGDVRDVTLVRNREGAPAVEQRPEPMTEIKHGVYYLDLSRLKTEEFEAALPRLSQARGVVMDMRGHTKIEPWTIASHLIDKPIPVFLVATPVAMRPNREATTLRFHFGATASPEHPRIQGKVVVIADGRAMSADETFLGMVEEFQLAEIVGSTSAGTNGVINTFLLPGGYQVRWTGRKVLKLDGSQHHGVGIAPTVSVERTIEGVAEGRDELLERAVLLIEQKR